MNRPAKQEAQNSETIIKTPLGYLSIAMSESSLSSINILVGKHRAQTSKGKLSRQVERQIVNYFQSPKHKFDLPLSLTGTSFQKKVWRALLKIPVGQTRTYGQLAKQLNTASRAIGMACRANPVPIIIPCHRVVSVSGIGGYMGKTSGRNTSIKQWLLDHEQKW